MSMRHSATGKVDPIELMHAVQECVVDATDALLLVESGNSFGWANQYLRFEEPFRYRISMLWGSLGHANAGAIGAAVAHSGRVVVLTGDGAMLFGNELSTAVAQKLQVVWIVLNDGEYGSCVAGQGSRGLSTRGLELPETDFAAYARALGAEGIRVESSAHLSAALKAAMTTNLPYVVDVIVHKAESPLAGRFSALFGDGDSGPK